MDPDWRGRAAGLQAKHSSHKCIAATDLARAMGELWRLIGDAPSDLFVAYRNLSEDLLKASARASHDALAEGWLNWSLSGDWSAVAVSIGGQLWALDAELAGRPRFAAAPSSTRSFFCPEADAFIIPRRTPKATNRREGPGNGFGRRGTPHHRILPRIIDGKFEVELHWSPHLAIGPTTGVERLLGAALWPDLEMTWVDRDDSVVAQAAACNEETEALRSQIEGAFSNELLVAAWPELSMPEHRLHRLQAALAKRVISAPPRVGPSLVAAGSWHEKEGDVVRNVMRILDKTGRERLRFEKITTFVSGTIREGNEPGRKIPVLLNNDALVTFAVCSDFCDLDIAVPYLQLDVDLVIVASLGNAAALKGHEGNAAKLGITLGAATFVVQQHDAGKHPMGWVFPTDAEHPHLAENEPWSVRRVCFS